MQLTLFTDYALRSLIFLAAHPERSSSVKEIAEHYGISRNHLVKIIHKMATLGLIETSKGKGGGVRLGHDPEAMRLLISGSLVRAQVRPPKFSTT
jgi:Rrf2 family nitric oxide-sensitive transcriptional repressor